jgi:hypothetical protein
MIRAFVRSYGESSTETLSPGTIRMKCLRILPEICARTLRCPGRSTRNIVPGKTCVTVPSVMICSSFANARRIYLRRHAAQQRRKFSGVRAPNVRAIAPSQSRTFLAIGHFIGGDSNGKHFGKGGETSTRDACAPWSSLRHIYRNCSNDSVGMYSRSSSRFHHVPVWRSSSIVANRYR